MIISHDVNKGSCSTEIEIELTSNTRSLTTQPHNIVYILYTCTSSGMELGIFAGRPMAASSF